MSSTSRVIRSSSAMPICRALATSSTSVGSISSRWPRTIVIGVFSSWRTSSSSWRCTSTEPSSRSSIEFTVRDRSAMSSLPCVGRRGERSVIVIVSAVSRMCADRREQAPGDEPADDSDRAEHDDRGDDVGVHRRRHRLELGAEVDRAHVDARVVVAGDLHRDRDVAQRPVIGDGGAPSWCCRRRSRRPLARCSSSSSEMSKPDSVAGRKRATPSMIADGCLVARRGRAARRPPSGTPRPTCSRRRRGSRSPSWRRDPPPAPPVAVGRDGLELLDLRRQPVVARPRSRARAAPGTSRCRRSPDPTHATARIAARILTRAEIGRGVRATP